MRAPPNVIATHIRRHFKGAPGAATGRSTKRYGLGDKSAVMNGNNIPRLSFSVIRTPRPHDGQQLHYRDLLRSLTNDADAIPAIEHYLTKEGQALLATSHTRGNYHAEALMSSFLFAASESAPGDGIVHDGIRDVLDSLRGAKPVIVASKRCCPVCQTIIHYLGEHNYQQLPILDAHNSISSYVLPPLLPSAVRQNVITFYTTMLAGWVSHTIAAFRAEQRLDGTRTPESEVASSHGASAEMFDDDETPPGISAE
jgi:hypothetical protein